MARPKKTGLDYFSFDTDLFSDEKIIAISKKYGLIGEMTYIKLLCAIYRNGYYVEWNESMKIKLLMSIPDIEEATLDSIINYSIKIGLFDNNMFFEFGVLTSTGIQKRFFEAKKLKNKNEMPYLLVRVNSEKTMVFDEKTHVFDEKTMVIDEKMPQSKEKKSKINKKIISNEITKKEPLSEPQVKKGELNSIETLRHNFSTHLATENMMMSLKIPDKDQYLQMCNEILAEWIISKGTDFAITPDVKHHFINTLRVKAEKHREHKPRGELTTRLANFRNEIAIEKTRNGYDSEMCNLFFNYWTETDNNGNMRFENESHWDTTNRLTIWKLRKQA